MSIIKTEFGNASINNSGYFRITSRKEKNHGKLLHVCIWEHHYKKSVPNGYEIHHIDKNKTNNKVSNLQCVESESHKKKHMSGKNHPLYGIRGKEHHFYGKKHSNQTKRKLSKYHADFTGEKHPRAKITEEIVIKIRKLKKQGAKRIIVFRKIGEPLGLSRGGFDSVWYGKNWKHIKIQKTI